MTYLDGWRFDSGLLKNVAENPPSYRLRTFIMSALVKRPIPMIGFSRRDILADGGFTPL
jgi:hypothetical protein